MWKNYLKVALRNLFKEKLYSFINIAGLSVGVGAVILMALFVKDEWTYDQFHTKADRIYRAWAKERAEDREFFNTVTPFILGPSLQDNFAEVESVVQLMQLNTVVKKETFSDQENINLISPQFLEVFDFQLLEGDADRLLQDLQQAIITPGIARKYFGEKDPMGQSISIRLGEEWQPFVVGGVIESPPGNSSLKFDILLSFENTKALVSERALQSWTMVNPETYVLLRENADPSDLKKKFQPFVDEKVSRFYPAGAYEVGFQPLTDIHLNNEFPAGLAAVSDWRYPYILGGIALLILVLAGINFITLSVGRSVSRAREVGVRKVSGATRMHLITQYWSESLLVALLAIVGGVLLAELVLPIFNQLADKQLALIYNLPNIAFLLGLALMIGLVAGSYPALVISGFSPIKAIRGHVSKLGSERHLVLRGLVGVQFVLSVGLIACTMIMQQQMRFLQRKNLGFNKAYQLVLPYKGQQSVDKGLLDLYAEGQQKADRLKQELAGRSDILAFTTSAHTLGTPGWLQAGYTDPETRQFRQFYSNMVDYNYLDAMGIELKEGRPFSEEVITDAQKAVIVNESMAKTFGLEDQVGQPMPPPFEELQLIGIVKDFNFASLHNAVEPLLLTMNISSVLSQVSDVTSGDQPLIKMTIKIDGEDVPATVGAIKASWAKVAPEQPFNFRFVDDDLDRLYAAESRLSRILGLGTILAIFIAGMGLFGIATLTVASRTKEIGIRKVMGASVTDILLLLNGRFTWMVLAASVVATPLAYYFMQKWLADFAYHIRLNPLFFVLAAVLAVVVAWGAVSYHSLRAATSNPVEALRNE